MKLYKKQDTLVVEYDTVKEKDVTTETPKQDIGELSDGYHTFNELYEFRKLYNAALFNEWGSNYKKINDPSLEVRSIGDIATTKCVHKSWKHHDGELAFGGGWFIVSAMLPTGLISNHYEAKDWDLFKVPEVPKALFEYDGHTAEDVKQRLRDLLLAGN